MRLVLLGLLVPLAACASVDPGPNAAAPATAIVADAASGPAAASSSDGAVQVASKAEPKRVCWTEIVTGTRGRRQTVCRDEKSERDADLMRQDLKTFQDRASGTQGQTVGVSGGG